VTDASGLAKKGLGQGTPLPSAEGYDFISRWSH